MRYIVKTVLLLLVFTLAGCAGGRFTAGAGGGNSAVGIGIGGGTPWGGPEVGVGGAVGVGGGAVGGEVYGR